MILCSTSLHHRRRGAVIVFALVMLVVLIGFASLTLDVGALYNARADLQNAADAAALSGASVLSESAMAQVRIAKQSFASEVSETAYERAVAVASQLTSFGGKNVVLSPADVLTGWIDLDSPTSDIDTSGSASQYNSIHVVAHRSEASANGPVVFFFASIFGNSSADVSASATAAFDDRVAGYDPARGGADLFPISMSIYEYNKELAKNEDYYEFDVDTGNVSSGEDGAPEVDLYPFTDSPGNFGLLNVGKKNNSVGNVADWIANGVSADDLEAETGEPVLAFYDGDGNAVTYSISGTPGLKASLEGDIKARIGDVVAIPIHSAAVGSGANTKYTVVGVRFARIMAVELNGGSKGLWIQPVSYMGLGLIMEQGVPSSEGVAGRVVLVR